MIARGSFGQPWIFDQARDLLDGRPMRPEPPVEERFAIALDHARMANDYEPDRKGAALEFRKHLGWYCKGLPGSAELRKKLHAVTSLTEVGGIFEDYLENRQRWIDAGARPAQADDGAAVPDESLETAAV
jgi:tRNA-dihydrouridine synthase